MQTRHRWGRPVEEAHAPLALLGGIGHQYLPLRCLVVDRQSRYFFFRDIFFAQVWGSARHEAGVQNRVAPFNLGMRNCPDARFAVCAPPLDHPLPNGGAEVLLEELFWVDERGERKGWVTLWLQSQVALLHTCTRAIDNCGSYHEFACKAEGRFPSF
jgi:hypothetical protein